MLSIPRISIRLTILTSQLVTNIATWNIGETNGAYQDILVQMREKMTQAILLQEQLSLLKNSTGRDRLILWAGMVVLTILCWIVTSLHLQLVTMVLAALLTDTVGVSSLQQPSHGALKKKVFWKMLKLSAIWNFVWVGVRLVSRIQVKSITQLPIRRVLIITTPILLVVRTTTQDYCIAHWHTMMNWLGKQLPHGTLVSIMVCSIRDW